MKASQALVKSSILATRSRKCIKHVYKIGSTEEPRSMKKTFILRGFSLRVTLVRMIHDNADRDIKVH